MMSSVEQWSKRDGTFNLHNLYEYIVTLLDPNVGMDEEWIDGTLQWWKK
jgi:hypothetical protein